MKVLSSRVDDVTPSYTCARCTITEEYVTAAEDRNAIASARFLGNWIPTWRNSCWNIVPRVRTRQFSLDQIGYGGSLRRTRRRSERRRPSTSRQSRIRPHTPTTPLPKGNGLLQWVEYMLSLDNVPQIVSTSFSSNEQDFPERVCIRGGPKKKELKSSSRRFLQNWTSGINHSSCARPLIHSSPTPKPVLARKLQSNTDPNVS